MAIEKNETAIQLLKILYSSSKKSKKAGKTSLKRNYPHGIENRYKNKLSSYFKPLIDYVNQFLENNLSAMLRGDSSEYKLDAIPGGTFNKMIQSLEGWVAVYMPTITEMQNGQNNVIYAGLGETADSLKQFEDKQFSNQIKSAIGVEFNTNAPWWSQVKQNWANQNYNLIKSNSIQYIGRINTAVENAIINGLSIKQLTEQIKSINSSLSDKKCKLLARDQIGKLNGQVTQAQMEEIGLDMYIWSTSGDERVRGNPAGKYAGASPSHYLMDNLLCRWDDPNVYSPDGGKHWIERPFNAVRLHPGQDIQCRCVALSYYPELMGELSGEPLEVPALSLPTDGDTENITAPVPEIKNFTKEQAEEVEKLFKSNLYLIEDEVLRKQVEDSFKDIAYSNVTNRAIFNKTVAKMNKPVFMINDIVEKNGKRRTAYYPTLNVIKVANHNILKNKTNAVHEIAHAFSELNKVSGKPMSRVPAFMKCVNVDYSNLLVKHGGKEIILNSFIDKLLDKNIDSYSVVADIVSGKQGKKIFRIGHGTNYWEEDEFRIYDESFAEVYQSIFDKKTSKIIKEFFPETYNYIKKEISKYLKVL